MTGGRFLLFLIYTMDEVREAHERLESNQSFGKVVLIISGEKKNEMMRAAGVYEAASSLRDARLRWRHRLSRRLILLCDMTLLLLPSSAPTCSGGASNTSTHRRLLLS